MPSNYTLISQLEDLNHAKLRLYQVHGNAKFFKESDLDNHLDHEYSKNIGYVDRNQTVETLYFLFEEFMEWLQKNESISSLQTAYLSQEIMPMEYANAFDIKPTDSLLYFLDYGTLLGSHRNQSIIPWDVNGDIGFMIKDLQQLPLEYESKEWHFKQNPMFHQDEMALNVYDSHNTVAARVISKENGVFINVMPYSFVHKTDSVTDAYVYSTADFLSHEKWHKASDLFPLNKTGGTLRHLKHLCVPNNVNKWLLTYYDSLAVPEEHKHGDVDSYNYDDYNYWAYDGNKLKDLKDQLEAQKEGIERLKELILAKK